MAEVTRERWTSRYYFLFAAIGSAIGLGNVWRFPWIAYDNGGGAFLIPWIVGLIVLGIPWMMMEFGMGRYFQRGAPGVFEGIGKKWEWVGWWPAFMAFLIVTYYTVIIAWSLRYVVSSATLAWGAGKLAVEGAPAYFEQVLDISSGPGVLGGLQWPLVAGLAFTWVALFFIMYKGARVIGKVAVWTVTIPWALLLILLIRGLTLPGAIDGLNYYLTPNLAALGNVEVWFAAFSQIAFTLSLGMAGMFAYGSFIAKKADVTNNAFITSFSNCATSFFAGFAVFSIVGFVVGALGTPVEQAVSVGSSVGLAFMAFPTGISMMPAANELIGITFFLCLFFLGIDSAFFLTYGGVISPLMDKFGWSRVKVTAIVCVVAFLIGLVFTTSGGVHWLTIVDQTACFYGLLITGALACIVVGWVFGAGKLREHLNETSDIKVGAWFDWLLKVVVPAGLLFVVIWGGFKNDLFSAFAEYQVGILNGSHIIWILLVVTLGLSFVLQAVKTKGPKEVSEK